MLPLISPANIDFVKRKSNTPPSDFSFFYEDLMFLITAVANTGRTFPAMVPSPIVILSGAKDLPAYRCFTSFSMTSQNMASREAAWHKKSGPRCREPLKNALVINIIDC